MKCCIDMFLEIFLWKPPPTCSYSPWPRRTSSASCQVTRDISTHSLQTFELARSHIWPVCLLAPVPISLGRTCLPAESLPLRNVSSDTALHLTSDRTGFKKPEAMIYTSSLWLLDRTGLFSLFSNVFRSQYCSVLTILAFSCERYMAICQPLYSYTISGVRRTMKIIFLLILLSALCASPFAFFTKINYQRFDSNL